MSEQTVAKTAVRAKFRCNSTKQWNVEGSEGPKEYEFSAIYDTSTPENERYSKYTPYGVLTIKVDNPAVSFTPGKDYYLDFTEA